MLSLFTRRVALSAHSSTATYRRVLPSPALILRARTIADTGLHIVTARTFTGSQRNASTKATAKTKETKSSTKPVTAGRVKVRRRLTPEQKAALKQVYDAEKELERRKKAEKAVALKAKQKARAEKEKEAAARKRKQLAEMKKKKLADAKEREKEKKKAKEAKKPELIKPPPRRFSTFSLFIQEAKKPIHEAVADWHNLTEEKKQEYAVRANALREKRKEEFDAFVKTVTRSEVMRYNRHQRAVGKLGIRVKFPSRPLSPFFRYSQVFRARPDQVGKRPPDVSSAAGEAWRSMTQEEKDQYKYKPTEETNA